MRHRRSDGSVAKRAGLFAKLRQQASARKSQHAEQGELAAPAQQREKLRRKNEESASGKRHEREHIEVGAVGARQARAASCFRLGREREDTGR